MSDTIHEDEPVALVTGAARGIGAATARHLTGSGWRVAAVDLCADDPALSYPLATPDDLVATISACGPDRCIGITADVRSPTALREAVARTVDTFGRLDAAVAAAGVIAGGPPLWDMDDAQWRAVIDIDLDGVRNVAGAAIPAMLERPTPRTGRFVAVGSAAGVRGMPRLAAYNAAKHGVVGLVRGLAADLADSGITANVVAPGSTRTDILDASASVYDLGSADEFVQHSLQHRLLDPDEVAAMITWVCSPASSGVTGAVLPVDVGMTAT